jgi:argininosuccinate lyase
MAEKKIWSGRFEAGADPLMEQFSHSLDIDQKLFDADIAVNQAWARALVAVGVYSTAEAEQVSAALADIQRDFHSGKLPFPESVEDIHSANERWLTDRLGDLGSRIHTGRSRNDQVVTDLRIYLREQNLALQNAIRTLQSGLVDLAEIHIKTVFPGHTHFQQAQPVSFAHYLLALFFQMQRNSERLQQIFQRCNRMPLGSGAIAGSAFAVDREAPARELGFDAPTENSYDATSDRDFVLELGFACAQIMVHLSRVAEDFILWSSEAFRFVRVDERYATGSSMMPQKRNPDALELIRGKAARVIGNLVSGLTLLKGAPTAYVRDLQEDKPPLFDSLQQTILSVTIFDRVLRTLTINIETMRAALDPALYATDVADYLVRKGMPFRLAHQVVGRLVQQTERRGVTLRGLALTDYRESSELFEQDVFELFDPLVSLNKRNIPGGTGIEAVEQQIKTAKKMLCC